MLSRFLNFFPKKNLVGLSRERCADDPQPEYFKLKKKPDEDLVFMFDNRITGYPVAYAEAYADQNFCAFIHNEPNQPGLVFRKQVDENRIQPTARLKGVVVRVRKESLELLDTVLGNKVECHRKKTRILLPFKKANGVMVNFPAWMYHDNPEKWRDRFSFDFSLFRGRRDGEFRPAALDYNPRFPHIEKFYVHPWLSRMMGLEEERADANRRAQYNNKLASTVS
jgi:hypothetical protein